MIDWMKFGLEIQEVIRQGGIVLWLMLFLSVVLYSLLISTCFGFFKLLSRIPEISNIMDTCHKEADVIREIEIFELEELAWVERRIPMIAVMIALAPLSGLLGTVSGMLNTFAGLSTQAAAKPIDSISSGISEALVTTQAGLFMAIPAAFFLVLLKVILFRIKGKIEQQASSKIIALKGVTV